MGGKRRDNFLTVLKGFTTENVYIVTTLFRMENSVKRGSIGWWMGIEMRLYNEFDV